MFIAESLSGYMRFRAVYESFPPFFINLMPYGDKQKHERRFILKIIEFDVYTNCNYHGPHNENIDSPNYRKMHNLFLSVGSGALK
jgi:hypothetical protein